MLNLNDDIGQPTVTYANGVTGKLVYTKTGFKKAMLTLHLESAAPVEGELATLTFQIDAGLDTTVNQFTYTVSNIALTAANGEAGILQHPARPAGGRHVQRDRGL